MLRTWTIIHIMCLPLTTTLLQQHCKFTTTSLHSLQTHCNVVVLTATHYNSIQRMQCSARRNTHTLVSNLTAVVNGFRNYKKVDVIVFARWIAKPNVT